MASLVVGTADGVVILDEDGSGTWNVAARLLPGAEVNNLVAEASGTVLASSRESGLVRIDVERATATPLGAGTLPQAVRSIAISPADPAVIYAGTEPAALFCSRDGGATWSEDAQVAGMREARKWQYPGNVKPHIRNIVIDREDPQLIFAAVQIGGVLRTEDGGAHWEDLTVDIDPDVHKIVQHPTAPNVFFAVTGGGGEYPHPTPAHRLKPPYPHGRPLYKSTDRGKTWNSMSDDVPQSYGVPLAVTAGERPMLLAGVAYGVPPRWAAREDRAGAQVIVSADEGASWAPVSDGLPAPSRSMIETIEVDSRRNRIYVGTSGDGRDWAEGGDSAPCPGAIYYSRDVTRGWAQVPVALPEVLALCPR
ncbi:MAG TPA: hypothetical protein VGP41_16375 [Candidatus Lustribacter sp.]|jgi:hypothetical protein|nr:hypothetical protein [Candidatus Lustribacter sp.]